MSYKPLDYDDRRRWQDAAISRGEVPECGRMACANFAEPAWANRYTPLLYCEECARLINSGGAPGMGICYPCKGANAIARGEHVAWCEAHSVSPAREGADAGRDPGSSDRGTT